MALCHTFCIQPFGYMNTESYGHKAMDFTGTARIRPANLITWFIDHCLGNIDLRCTVALRQSLVCLADVASWLNMLCWIALSTKNYTKANVEIFPDTAKERQPSLLTLKWSTISLHQLSIWTSWFSTFSSLRSCKITLVELEASVFWISADWQ